MAAIVEDTTPADLCMRVVFTDSILCFSVVLVKLLIRKWSGLSVISSPIWWGRFLQSSVRMVAVITSPHTSVSDVCVEESGAVLGQPGIDSEVATVLLQNPQGTRKAWTYSVVSQPFCDFLLMRSHSASVKQESMRGEERNLAKLEMEDFSERLLASLERADAVLVTQPC